MKTKSILTKLALVTLVGLMLMGSGIILCPWVKFSETPQNVYMPASAQCPGDNSSYYLIGGMTDRDVILDTLWHYHAELNRWRVLTPLPIPLVGAAATCYNGSIYVAGGITTEIKLTSGPTSAFLIYDIARDSWRYGPRLPRKVWGAGLAAWKGKLYLFGGTPYNFRDPNPLPTDFLPVPQVDVYRLTGTPSSWKPNAMTPMPFPATHFGWVQSGKYVYAVGGKTTLSENSKIAQRFDIELNYWMRGPDLPNGHYGQALVDSESHLHLIGGYSYGEVPSFSVMSLEKGYWPKGEWDSNLITGLPQPLFGSAGFCTEVEQVSTIWAVGGMTARDEILNANQCHPVANCFVDPD